MHIHFDTILELPNTTDKNNAVPSIQINEKLPVELILNIFSFLTQRELYLCALTCKTWSILTNENILWKYFYKKDFFFDALSDNAKESYKRNHEIRLNISNRNYVITSSSDPLKEFLTRLANEKSWNPQLFRVSNDNLITAYKESINVIDLKTQKMEIIKFLDGDSPISCIEVSGNSGILFAGYQNSLIEVWDIKEKICVCKFKREDNPAAVSSLFHYKQKILLAGYQDGKIIKWNINKPNKPTTIEDRFFQDPIVQFLKFKDLEDSDKVLLACTNNLFLKIDFKSKRIYDASSKNPTIIYAMGDFDIIFICRENGILSKHDLSTSEDKYICRWYPQPTWMQYNNGRLYAKVEYEVSIVDFTQEFSLSNYLSKIFL